MIILNNNSPTELQQKTQKNTVMLKEFILKIIYTIDNEVSPFLSRSLRPVPVQYIDTRRNRVNFQHDNIFNNDINNSTQLKNVHNDGGEDEDDDEISSMGFGYVSLNEVLDLISVNSPELFETNNNKQNNESFLEYNVYYRDILEDKEPYVSCGFLTDLNENINGMNVVGRVVKNFSGLVRSNGNCFDILEVKLKFSKLVTKMNTTGSKKNSPIRTLMNKNSPIQLNNLKEKKLPTFVKKQKKKRTTSLVRQLSTNDSLIAANNSLKPTKSSIMRKIMEKDVLISSLKENQHNNNNNITNNSNNNNNNFLDSSPGSNDVFLSSSINGSSNDNSSNLPSYYSSSTGNNSNISSSILNSNIIKKVTSNNNDNFILEDEENDSNYSDINKRFDFSKMKQQRSSSNTSKKKKIVKKKKIPKNKLQMIIKEKENLIPQIISDEAGSNSIIKTTTGVSFDLEEILLENGVLLSPPTTQQDKLLSSWIPVEEENIINSNIEQPNSRSKLSNEIFDLEFQQPQFNSSPQQQNQEHIEHEAKEDKTDHFFNDLKSMGIELDDSYSAMMPDGIINLSAGDVNDMSGVVLDSDFFVNFEEPESNNSNNNNNTNTNNNVVEGNEKNAFLGISSSPALI